MCRLGLGPPLHYIKMAMSTPIACVMRTHIFSIKTELRNPPSYTSLIILLLISELGPLREQSGFIKWREVKQGGDRIE